MSFLLEEFNKLMDQQWKFLYKEWPQIKPSKYHRSDTKPVNRISYIKDIVLQRLGIIPVFFFLVVVFPTQDYPGPYRNVEKGLLILYQLLQGYSLNEMLAFIPKSSYYDIFRKFYQNQVWLWAPTTCPEWNKGTDEDVVKFSRSPSDCRDSIRSKINPLLLLPTLFRPSSKTPILH